MRKKILAIIATMAMVVAMVPSMVFAADATTLPEAENGVITLEEDVTLAASFVVAADKDITIDLNGYTVSMSDDSGTACYMIKNEGNLTIKDSSAAGTGKITFVSTTPDSSFGYSTSTIGNAGTLTVESGTIENNTSGGASYAIDNYWYTQDVTLNVTGGTVKAAKNAIRQVPFSTTYKNVVNITGGAITGGYAAVQTHNYSGEALAEVNISGDAVLTGTYAYYTYYSSATGHKNTDIEISGGVFDGYLYIYNGNVGSANTEFKKLSITGGTFNEAISIYCRGEDEDDYEDLPVISGGTFASDPSEYNNVAPDYVVESYVDNDGNTVYGVEPVYNVTITATPDDATIVVKDADRNEVVAEDGTYKLINGTYTYVVSKDGYDEESGEFVVEGQNKDIAITLSETALGGEDGEGTEGEPADTEEPEDEVDTGDDMNMVIPFTLAGLAVAAMAAVVFARRRYN